jgi:hypothetical protein
MIFNMLISVFDHHPRVSLSDLQLLALEPLHHLSIEDQ